MKLVGKVPVEPLDEERLTNIERRLVVQASELAQQRTVRAPRRLLGFAALAAAVAVAGFVGWKLHRDPVAPVAQPEHLAMKAGALVVDGAEIAGTDFEVTRMPGHVEVAMLHAGKLDLHVAHDPARLLVVRVGGVEIEDVGTRFTVDYDGTNVAVRVTEGAVKVKRAGKEQAVTAGNAWSIELGPVTIAALDAADQARVIAQVQVPDPTDVVNAAGSGSGAVRGGSNASAGSNDSGSGSGKPRRAGGPDARKSLEKWLDEPLVATDERDPRKAIVRYLAQVQNMPEGEQKAEYLQSIAVMQLRAKNYEAARRAVDGILHERESAGPWNDWKAYKSALWLDVRSTCLLARTRGPTFDDACRRRAEKFIVKFPTGPQAGAVQQVLNEI